MYRWIISFFAAFIIVISILGLIYPTSILEVLISTNAFPSLLRISLGALLLYYCWFSIFGDRYLKPILTIYAVALLTMISLYILQKTYIELLFFDEFIIIEGAVLVLIASLEQVPQSQPLQITKLPRTKDAGLVKPKLLPYDNVK